MMQLGSSSMITRIVKMTFRPEEVDNFLAVFDESSSLIRNFKGCNHLELLRDENDPCIFFTYSYWDSEEHLNHYRYSELFKSVWAKTSKLFAEKATAWSVQPIRKIEA
jgi:quinol monooxygenase YgiN